MGRAAADLDAVPRSLEETGRGAHTRRGNMRAALQEPPRCVFVFLVFLFPSFVFFSPPNANLPLSFQAEKKREAVSPEARHPRRFTRAILARTIPLHNTRHAYVPVPRPHVAFFSLSFSFFGKKTKADIEASIKITAQDSNWINLHRSMWIDRVKQLGVRPSSDVDDADDEDLEVTGVHHLHLVGRVRGENTVFASSFLCQKSQKNARGDLLSHEMRGESISTLLPDPTYGTHRAATSRCWGLTPCCCCRCTAESTSRAGRRRTRGVGHAKRLTGGG